MGTIDTLNKYIGKAAAWLVPLLILELVYDTIARYVFNAPTEWSYDVTYMLYGAIFMLGAIPCSWTSTSASRRCTAGCPHGPGH